MKIDYSKHNIAAFDPGFWNWFPSHARCSACGGSGFGVSEHASAFNPAYAEPCEHCVEGVTYSPKVRLIRRSRVGRINHPQAA